MKKRIVLCLLVLALLSVAGCAQKKDAEPLTVTLWHVYGGEVDSPLNDLIKRFNSTVGAKQNIRVKVELVSNSGSIHKSVLAAANSDPGAPSLPDMFVSYPKTVLALPDQDILTALYGDRVHLLDSMVYNLSDRILALHNAELRNAPVDLDWVRAHTVIIHYCGRLKPWKPHYVGVLDVFYHELMEEIQK